MFSYGTTVKVGSLFYRMKKTKYREAVLCFVVTRTGFEPMLKA